MFVSVQTDISHQSGSQTSISIALMMIISDLLNYCFSVFLRGVTWVRDSHGLFDYESKSITKKSCKTVEESKIIRIENEIELVPRTKVLGELGENAQNLLQIRKDQGKSLSLS